MKINISCITKSLILGTPLFLFACITSLLILILGIIEWNTFKIITGIFLLTIFLRLLLTLEKSIVFKDTHCEVKSLFLISKIEYENIHHVKFHPAHKYDGELVALKLKKRIHTRKTFVFDPFLNEENLLALFNFLRSKSVPTGLNGVGEKFLFFDQNTNLYTKKTGIL